MKIAGIGRRNKPNGFVLRKMQEYSTRAWVYREGQGWIFAELMPDELAEFKSYKCGITIPRMRIRLPSSPLWDFLASEPMELDNFANIFAHRVTSPDIKSIRLDSLANWFAYCTIPKAHPLAPSKFQIHPMTSNKPMSSHWHPLKPGSYEAWLWADEAKVCRELGCKISVLNGWGWSEWGVPAEWKPPLPPFEHVYKERVFIYAFVNELTQEVYVGQTENLERRRAQHLRDTKNADKAALIQSLSAQGREPKPIKLEEVAGEKSTERESYWTSYYKSQGYKITNHDTAF